MWSVHPQYGPFYVNGMAPTTVTDTCDNTVLPNVISEKKLTLFTNNQIPLVFSLIVLLMRQSIFGLLLN